MQASSLVSKVAAALQVGALLVRLCSALLLPQLLCGCLHPRLLLLEFGGTILDGHLLFPPGRQHCISCRQDLVGISFFGRGFSPLLLKHFCFCCKPGRFLTSLCRQPVHHLLLLLSFLLLLSNLLLIPLQGCLALRQLILLCLEGLGELGEGVLLRLHSLSALGQVLLLLFHCLVPLHDGRFLAAQLGSAGLQGGFLGGQVRLPCLQLRRRRLLLRRSCFLLRRRGRLLCRCRSLLLRCALEAGVQIVQAPLQFLQLVLIREVLLIRPFL
mmetsp:Transcript_1093/g.3328  ORF Transcript_1093/g.3328 Transcript_1093/m.3328 type:complete len:270 (+) Transcript_1093:1969-2778(+)